MVTSFYRYLPGLQIFPLPEPEYEVPNKPGMLPQNVRVLRRPHILFRPSPLSGGWLRAHITETTLPEADTSGHTY